MRNNFRVDGKIVYIELNRKDGSKLYTLVDLNDLHRLMKLDVRFTAKWNKDTRSFYAHAEVKINNKRTTLQLHRFIMNLNYGDKLQVDHKHHNTLDNRKSELRIVTNQQNQFNLRSTKGYYWNKRDEIFHAQIRANDKTVYLGHFDSEEDAHNAYLKAKEKYHKFN